MKCVVPLAGPDLYDPERGFRPLQAFAGRGILETALRGRAWALDGSLGSSDYVFVLRETPRLDVLRCYLESGWPGSRVATVSTLTGGALFSALAGVALVEGDETLCIDLADIFFDGPAPFWSNWAREVGAVTPCFLSDDPAYSYLRREGEVVVEAAEKRVISDRASAGVYFFRDCIVYLQAAAHSILNRRALAYRNTLFVCPSMNGVLAAGLKVEAPLVTNVIPMSKAFHNPVRALGA